MKKWWFLIMLLLGSRLIAAPAWADEASFTGLWRGPFGLIALEQSGAEVRGSFANEGVLSGTADSRVLPFRWQDGLKQAGEGQIQLAADGQSLQAHWTLGSSAPGLPSDWTAARFTDPPDPSGQRSYWQIAMEIRDNPQLPGKVIGSMVLFENGKTISGRLAGRMIFADAASGSEASSVQEGNDLVIAVVGGARQGNRLTLHLRNDQDGSESDVALRGDGPHYQGTWRERPVPSPTQGEPPQHGTLTLTRSQETKVETAGELAWQRQHRLWQFHQVVGQPWSSPLLGEPRLQIKAMIDRGAFDEAAAAGAAGAEAYRQAGDSQHQAELLQLRARALEQAGKFELARQAYRQSLDLPGVSSFTRDMAIGALKSLQDKIGGQGPSAQQSPIPDLVPDQNDPIVLKERALEHQQAGRFDEALALYDQAAAIYRAERASLTNPVLQHSRDVSLGVVLQKAGMVEAHRKHWDAAAERYRQALAVWEAQPNGAGPAAGAAGALSSLSLTGGHPAEARAAILRAIAIAEAGHLGERWQFYAQAAKVELAENQDKAADAFFQQAIANIETLRGGLITDEAKIGFFAASFGSPVQVYEAYVAFLMDRAGQPETALEIAERVRARALLDALSVAKQGTEGNPIAGETLSPAIAVPLSAAEIRQLAISKQTAYLSYFITARTTYVWLLTPDGEVKSGRVELAPAALEQTVTELKNALSLSLGSSFWERPRQALTESLSAPVADALAALPKDSRLTIIPHKILAEIPFAALGQQPGDWNERWNLAVLPSLSIARSLTARPIPTNGPLLAVGEIKTTPPLLYSAEEIERSAALFPGATILRDSAATRARVIAELPKHQLILFSTHAWKRAIPKTDRPSLARSQGDEMELELGKGEVLVGEDLRPGQLPTTSLVILSACDTIKGRQHVGDEVLNLARAFLIAGAERVIVTLWQAEDGAAAKIVPALLERLHQGTAPAEALRAATRDYRQRPGDDGASPSFSAWTPWLLVGGHD